MASGLKNDIDVCDRHQGGEQSINGKVFHNLFTQQPPLRGTRLKIILPSRST